MRNEIKSFVGWVMLIVIVGYGVFSLIQDIIYKFTNIWI